MKKVARASSRRLDQDVKFYKEGLIMKLVNEDTEFTISTTGAVAEYSDDGKLIIRLCAEKKSSEEQEIFSIEIHFERVAELICKTVNFYEVNYKEFEIVTSDGVSSDTGELSGFYRVLDSERLAASIKIYDPEFYRYLNSQSLEFGKVAYAPKNRLNLKHYLVVGGDGYFEIIASSYEIKVLSLE
jgi:hypothetical protein